MNSTWKDYLPIAISSVAALISMFSLGWNVYRDIVLKARIKVSVRRGFTASEFHQSGPQFFVSAVNFGPGKVRLNMVWYRRRSWLLALLRKQTQGALIFDYRNPLSGRLPATLEVGESIDLPFPWQEGAVFSRLPTHLGFSDSFGRNHWAARSELRNLCRAWKRDFGTRS